LGVEGEWLLRKLVKRATRAQMSFPTVERALIDADVSESQRAFDMTSIANKLSGRVVNCQGYLLDHIKKQNSLTYVRMKRSVKQGSAQEKLLR
jgi:flagellar biosynthesis/type III secretory pathway ATPase